jgi:hypothetical protein
MLFGYKYQHNSAILNQFWITTHTNHSHNNLTLTTLQAYDPCSPAKINGQFLKKNSIKYSTPYIIPYNILEILITNDKSCNRWTLITTSHQIHLTFSRISTLQRQTKLANHATNLARYTKHSAKQWPTICSACDVRVYVQEHRLSIIVPKPAYYATHVKLTISVICGDVFNALES